MGWLFAVALGLHRGLPIPLGHALRAPGLADALAAHPARAREESAERAPGRPASPGLVKPRESRSGSRGDRR